jgi:hypothetical protein
VIRVVKRTLTVTIRISGLRETIRAFKQWPEDAITEIRAASFSIAGVVAVRIKGAARLNAQSALIAPTVRAQKDRLPVIIAGGTRRVGRNKVPAFKVLFGAEFGAVTLAQFRAFNAGGYFFFSTVDAEMDYISSEYVAAVDEVNRRWAL